MSSPTFGSLVPYFGSIIHTESPFPSDSEWEIKLLNCCMNSFRLAWIRKDSNSAMKVARASVATVLFGADCRGIKVENAADAAARACHLFSQEPENQKSNSPIHFSTEDGVTPRERAPWNTTRAFQEIFDRWWHENKNEKKNALRHSFGMDIVETKETNSFYRRIVQHPTCRGKARFQVACNTNKRNQFVPSRDCPTPKWMVTNR